MFFEYGLWSWTTQAPIQDMQRTSCVTVHTLCHFPLPQILHVYVDIITVSPSAMGLKVVNKCKVLGIVPVVFLSSQIITVII